jgi:hypothetical protein
MLSLNSVWFFSSPCGKGRHRQRLKIEPRSAVRGGRLMIRYPIRSNTPKLP